MNQIIYTKIDADGNPMPNDAEGHLAVRVEHPLLKQPLIVSAYRVANDATWKEAAEACEKFEANGWSWRLPTVEEAFLIPDRSQYPSLPKQFFPDAEGWEWIWTSTPDAEDPAPYAWSVVLGGGYSYRVRQSYHLLVRAVRAGQ